MSVIEQLTVALAGHYAIEREIGAGGMATVFLARDLKHARHVALKVLNPELGAVVGVERFLAEIRVTANLQHPNLLPLFDSGEASAPYGAPGSGLLFYVMPYVEGESLRARLQREKQLPVEEAVRIASAIAGALDYAHKHGVIHRDLKPENILLQEEQPLLADFGIALAVSNAGGNRITQTGLSLGTPAYMSPEQATGDRAIDGRTDIYSLGAILYEMLTGEPPHSGNTAQAVIAKVITDKPRSIRLARDTVPEHVEHAVERALAKLPADRYPTGRDFVNALEGRTHSTAYHVATPGMTARSRRRWLIPALAAGLMMTTALGTWGLLGSRAAPADPASVVRFALEQNATNGVGFTQFAFASDGRSIAYTARGADSVHRLYVRRFDELTPRRPEGTENATWPAFSPNGEWIAYVAGPQLNKVRATGGAAVTLATELVSIRRMAWLTDSAIVLSNNGVLATIPANGGPITPIPSDSVTSTRWYPAAFDNASLVLYTEWTGNVASSELAVADVRTGRTERLGLKGSYALAVVNGELVYVNNLRGVSAVPFDVAAGRTRGAPRTLISDALLIPGMAAVSPRGSLVYRPIHDSSDIVVSAPSGTRVLTSRPGPYSAPRMSPGGRRVAFAMETPGRLDIMVQTLANGALERLTNDGVQNDRPEWAPDGRVLYRSDRTGRSQLWLQPVDGSAPPRVVWTPPGLQVWQGMFSTDGRHLAFRTGTLSGADVWYRATSGDTTPRLIHESPASEQSPVLSPDGRWVTYSSAQSGRVEVFVKPFPSVAARYRVAQGRDARWGPDSRTLYFSNGPRIMRARLNVSGEVQVVAIDTVVRNDVEVNAGHPIMDVLRDGSLLYVRTRPSLGPAIVVANWKPERGAER